MNATYALHDFRRVMRDVPSMFFIVVLPAALFVFFGVLQGWVEAPAGRGNVSAYMMVSMACYGAAIATTSVAGTAAVERLQGWGRQLAMTPLGTRGYTLTKAVVGMAVAVVPLLLVFLVGAATSAAMDAGWRWVASGAILILCSAVFALYGLAAGLLFRSDNAVGAASGLLVVLGFLGNVFTPLSGAMLEFARWTPMYGMVGLARYPITEGQVVTMSGAPQTDSVWLLLANVVGWTVVFAAVALFAARRATARS